MVTPASPVRSVFQSFGPNGVRCAQFDCKALAAPEMDIGQNYSFEGKTQWC